MKIAVVTLWFPAFPETFVSREIVALRNLGHDLRVFVGRDCPTGGPQLPPVEGVGVERWQTDNVKAFAPDVLYGSLSGPAQARTFELAQELDRPFALRIWQGCDTFAFKDAAFYERATRHRLCLGAIVEDEWMAEYAVATLKVERKRIVVVPNSLDLAVAIGREGPRCPGPMRVLAVNRLVKKKGMIHLLRAMRRLEPGVAVCTIIGDGNERWALEQEGRGVDGVRMPGSVLPGQLAGWYGWADVFAAPCVLGPSGDADGIPTSALEAMAHGVPVIASDLLSASCYIEHEKTGLLVPPGDEKALAKAIEWMANHPDARLEMGKAAAEFARAKLDITKNIRAIEAVLTQNRVVVVVDTKAIEAAMTDHQKAQDKRQHWKSAVHEMSTRRASYTPERLAYYARIGKQCMDLFGPIAGDVLDVGCGDGSLANRLPAGSRYTGVDVALPPDPGTWFRTADAERLPFADDSFDVVICYSVLQHVLDPAAALREMRRVLRPGGKFAAQVCVADSNPMFLWHWTADDVMTLVRAAGFETAEVRGVIENRIVVVVAEGALPAHLENFA